MKLFRYRKPSLKTALGLTAAKRSLKKATGISAIEAVTKPSRIKQKVKTEIGLYGNPAVTAVRQAAKGKAPSPLGIFSRLKLW